MGHRSKFDLKDDGSLGHDEACPSRMDSTLERDLRSCSDGGRRFVGVQTLKSHVVSAMTGESDIGRKHLAHPAIIERHNEPVIIYLTVCSKDRKSVFAPRKALPLLSMPGKRPVYGLLAGMYLCRIIFIFFARPTDFLSRR